MKGFEKLEKEIQIEKVLKRLRLLEFFMRKDTFKQHRQEVRAKHILKEINLSSKSSDSDETQSDSKNADNVSTKPGVTKRGLPIV